jgi:integrase
MAAPKKARTMRRVKKRGFEGVYECLVGGKRVNFTAYVPDPSAKSKKRSLGKFQTAQEAKDARHKALAQTSTNVYGDETVASFAERWLTEFNTHNRGITKRGHKYHVKPFVERFGHLKLRRLADDEHFQSGRLWGRKDSVPVGYVAVARKMLNDAIDVKLLARGHNPLANIGRGKGPGRADNEVISKDELYELADCALVALRADFGPVFRGHILFSAHTGIRPSEARALRRVHVHPPSVDIFDNYGDDAELTTPKNHKRRTITCPNRAVEALRAMPANPASPYVFYGIRGQRLTKGTQHYYWDKTRAAMAAKTGDPKWLDIDFYEVTRHYCGSFMTNELGLTADVVAAQLGHADTDLVIRLYGHRRHETTVERVNQAWAEYEERERAADEEAAGGRRLRAVG